MSVAILVLLLVGAGLVFVIGRALLDGFAERHYLRGLDDNAPVQNWRQHYENARKLTDIALMQSLRWRQEVISLNKAQRKLRRRYAALRKPRAPTGHPSEEKKSE